LVTVFASGVSEASGQAFYKFALFLGLQADLIVLDEGRLCDGPYGREPAPPTQMLAFSQAVLISVFQKEWFRALLDQTELVFIYGFAPSNAECHELKETTAGAFASVSIVNSLQRSFKIHADVTHGKFPVSGLSYEAGQGATAVFGEHSTRSGVETYITVNGRPHFVSVARGKSQVFLLAVQDLVDIDTVLDPGEDSLRPWYAQLIALSIALRIVGGPWCWSSPFTPANFIVDDPYLRGRYGFIKYEALMKALQEVRGALTVAFIPYNYRRSTPKTVDLLLHNTRQFSIAVHGCDHTGGEYANMNEDWLTSTTGCALDRMEEHSRRTAMPFDNVMVFPQGRFSTKALRALESCGIGAAVNSSAWPSDYDGSLLTIRDLLQVAVTRYENYPIFVRRYPRDVFDFAFDALFQKPILAVEHHNFFRDGYGPLKQFMCDLSSIKANLMWMPLGLAVASSCNLRKTGARQYTVRHFFIEFHFKNPTSEDLHLNLEKPEGGRSVDSVLVNGSNVPFESTPGSLRYQAELSAGANLNVIVVYRKEHRARRKSSWKYRLSVSTRRLLCDFRDNYLDRARQVLRMTEG
jgi:hypothetical protein